MTNPEDLTPLQREVTRLEGVITRQNTQINDLRKERVDLLQERTAGNAERNALRNQLLTKEGVILDLQQRIKDFETAAIEDEAKIAGLEDDAQAYETQIKRITQELAGVRVAFQEQHTQAQRLNRENRELEKRVQRETEIGQGWFKNFRQATVALNAEKRKLRKAKSIIKKLTKV